MKVERFNLRVYGLLIRNEHVLVTDERRGGYFMTKFPGGGLEFGEGLEDCLKREFREELNIEITVETFFYTNEFLQVSAFNPKDQLQSFYFLVTSEAELNFEITSPYTSIENGEQRFRWLPLNHISSKNFTFPIDKEIAKQLKNL